MSDEVTSTTPIELATELTIAWLSNSSTRASSGDEVSAFLKVMYDAVRGLDRPEELGAAEESLPEYTPATTVRRSLSSPDHIISLIDGKPYKTLRRHLSRHGMTPEQYRERYKLKPDYPMVAPSYSEVRRSMAKKIGLGQKGRAPRVGPTTDGAPTGSAGRRGRRAKQAKPE